MTPPVTWSIRFPWRSGFSFTAQIRSTTTARLSDISSPVSISVAFRPAWATGSSTTNPARLPTRAAISLWRKSKRLFLTRRQPGMHLALIEPGSYLDFARPVPFNYEGVLVEQGLLNEQGAISGRAQSAVRPLSPADFDRILELGLDESEPLLPRVDPTASGNEMDEEQAPFVFEQGRDRVKYAGTRIVRDRVFRRGRPARLR